MKTRKIVRLPKVRSLSKILPAGTESGKEFARIVDLLLFNEARHRNETFTVFDDASGDYAALDSLSKGFRRSGSVGYQYKFFSSPLSTNHRAEIKESLRRAVEKSTTSKIRHWVIVTPDDFTNSRRKGGGDVSWFENLKLEFPELEIEHFGHTKLQNLFLQAQHLALYYYPEIVPEGAARRLNIEAVRELYNSAISERNGRIEFVGMSVYKEEATKGVPLESIYIPLSLVGEDQDDSEDRFPRTNPINLMSPGRRSVILGDPGSGKSTLISFLALSRVSSSIQTRFKAEPDGRLPIVITLRRYADELKGRFNLSILDYIVEMTRGEFSIKDATDEFFCFYLESGHAVVLFDGLDELPTTKFKDVVQKRIRAFATVFPLATIIITSRIAGYEGKIRFPTSFNHFRMAKLRLDEIEKFIRDWYAVRVENEVEQAANVTDLCRIIANPDSAAIRDLARNPLLLTIVALVHRIDAVLPDERVVLYQKCTETLLNTWYKWKFKDEDEKSKGRIERRNRQRIEAIAFWMQRRIVSTDRGRAVVPRNEMRLFLRDFIEKNEAYPTEDSEDPEDQADEFLEFVKSRTGLLIEAGDELYSFLHLTFQEYLTATYLISRGEVDGLSKIWEVIGADINNPRWREVVRLLVASLKSREGQKYLLSKLLSDSDCEIDNALLLAGLVLDGIEPAEVASDEIMNRVLICAQAAKTADNLRLLERNFRSWLEKDKRNKEILLNVFNKNMKGQVGDNRKVALLSAITLGVPDEIVVSDRYFSKKVSNSLGDYVGLNAFSREKGLSAKRLQFIQDLRDHWCIESPEANLVSAIYMPFSVAGNPALAWEREFQRALMLVLSGTAGPFHDYFWNIFSVAGSDNDLAAPIVATLRGRHSRQNERPKVKPYGKYLLPFVEALHRDYSDAKRHARSTDHGQHRIIKGHSEGVLSLLRHQLSRRHKTLIAEQRETVRFAELSDINDFGKVASSVLHLRDNFWLNLRATPSFVRVLSQGVVKHYDLHPEIHWQELIRATIVPQMPQFVYRFISEEAVKSCVTELKKSEPSPPEIFHAAWIMLADLWSRFFQGYQNEVDAPYGELLAAAKESPHSPLQVATSLHQLISGDRAAELKIWSWLEDREAPEGVLLRNAYWPHRRVVGGKATKRQ
ncbi:NACHT domain-containing NTPase [Dongia sp.]|uniref:NACHT domain-containing protein n=1 Tax=Dongia sp. TaxID=1977262 RepID=UPI0035B25CED